jgi:hypothetical protein
MALVSPGVQVTVIDQSQYVPSASNSVPLIILATAQNKTNAAGTGVAAATTKANANKLYQVTSQRDLVNLYGNPFFYKTSTNVPIQGYELNEYGLLAAYSLLGSTNRCFVLRADVDLASLTGSISRPLGNPAEGTYWLDTTSSDWGIYEWNSTTQKFVEKMPIVITDSTDLTDLYPKASLGNVGGYAVVASQPTEGPTSDGTYFFKNADNEWVKLGGSAWKQSIPTAVGSVFNPTLTAGDLFEIVTSNFTLAVAVPSSPNNTLDGVVSTINNYAIDEVFAKNIDNKLHLYSAQVGPNSSITVNNLTGTPLEDLGLVDGKTYYQVITTYGTSAQMPLWGTSQSQPRSSGSVWIKTSATGNGANLLLSKYNTTLDQYIAQTCNMYSADWTATYALDSTGGKAIPTGMTYGMYGYMGSLVTAPVILRERLATGETVATGTATNPTFTNNKCINVRVSVPGSSSLSSIYTVQMPSTGTVDAADFVTAWQAAGIPNTTAIVTLEGSIQLTHTQGGEIIIDDYVDNYGAPSGTSNNIVATAGLNGADTAGFGPFSSLTVTGSTTGGGGFAQPAGPATFSITAVGTSYTAVATPVNAGEGYSVGDVLTITGTQLGGDAPANNCSLIVTEVNGLSGAIIGASILQTSVAKPRYTTQISNWVSLTYTANEGAPASNPANNTNWFYSVADEVDIMVNQSGTWKGYRNVAFNSDGFPSSSGSPSTDPAGPICAAVAPTEQSDGTALVYGDLWISTSAADLENYPVLHRWQSVEGVNQWVLVDTTDQVSSEGVLFGDARWASSGSVDPVNDPIPTIVSMLTSNFTDLDCPDPDLYPTGMLLFNTRRSGNNVKQFKTNYFVPSNYPNGPYPTNSYTWVSASGLKTDGSPYMGRRAQRNIVVQALRSAVSTNMSIREEDTYFNLIAAPNYVELQPDMVTLNNERNNTAYIVGDTPLRLADQATAIQNWATNAAGASSSGEDGWVTRNEYLGVFYPSGITTDTTGAQVVVPASHMMLRTFLRNDAVAYPWLAAAGTRRGTIDNALNIGYLDATTGEFQVIKNRMGIRDVLYTNQINPLAFFTGVGLLNYGNKNSKDTMSAMDRTNVARLVCYIRERLQVLARPFVFEPNDALTRNQIAGVVQTLFIDLVAKRGLYDYIVQCDTQNNTPARIDRNELWIDIAIEPVKAAEFIYIPVRIMNTGALSASA